MLLTVEAFLVQLIIKFLQFELPVLNLVEWLFSIFSQISTGFGKVLKSVNTFSGKSLPPEVLYVFLKFSRKLGQIFLLLF